MIKFRLVFLLGLFFLIFGIVLYRAFQLQILPHDRIESFARRQGVQKIEITGRRAAILDRNGRDLAVSVNSLSLYAHPGQVQKPKRAARLLARVTGVAESVLLSKIESNRKFVWLARQLSQSQMKQLEKIDLKLLSGIGTLPEYRRIYPMGSVAAHTVGFVSVDGHGLEGVEKKFEDTLQGEKTTLRVRKDALGRLLITQKDRLKMDLKSGEPVRLTLDAKLQYFAEKTLGDAVREHEALGGVAIVMNPHNGEVLALANAPAFDPNRSGDTAAGLRRNRALTDPIEPGSVLKAFVVARALDDKIVRPQTQISAGNGFIQIGRKRIGEAEASHRFKSMSVADLIRLSSNVATVVLAQKLGFRRLEESFRELGFDKSTGLEVPSESKGIFPQLRENQLLEQATMSFGQGISLTPMQIAAGYAIFANGGYKVQPHLLKQDTPDAPGLSRRRIFSEQTAGEMRKILERVVEEEGTGGLAKVGSFRVAGKTGTSQKVDYIKGGYESQSYWSSFAGFLPAERPRYVIYVMIDRPLKKGYYGGVVVAPVFAKIAREAMRSGEDTEQWSPEEEQRLQVAPAPPNLAANAVPDVTGMSLKNAFTHLQSAGLQAELTTEGTVVADQIPGAGRLDSESKVIYLKLR